MEDVNNVSSPKKTLSKRKLLFWAGSIVVIVGAVLGTLYVIYRLQTIHTVQSAISSAAEVIEKANGNDGYPQTLPKEATENDKVKIEGGGTFDGTTYCITGTSSTDSSIVYHIRSGDKRPQNDACPAVNTTTKPESVTGIQTTVISAGQLGFTWQAATGGISYTLQCATNKDFTLNVASSMKASQTRTCNDLKPGTAYFIRVRANNTAGAGPWSNTMKISTTAISTAPTKLTLTATSTSSITYSWTPVDGAQSYVVEWASDVNFTKDVKSTMLINTSGTASGLKTNTRYFFHVNAVTANFDAAHAAFSPQEYTSTLAK
jgi:hypothetical protein